MKKILILISMFVVCSFSANSQTLTLKGTYGSTLDTITNAGTVYLTTTSGALSSIGLAGNYVIQFTAVSLSGTVSATVVLQSSIDGLSWSNHFGVAGQDGINCDTLTIAAAGNRVLTINRGAVHSLVASGVVTNQWYTNAGRRLHFRLKFVGSGTQSTKISGVLITSN